MASTTTYELLGRSWLPIAHWVFSFSTSSPGQSKQSSYFFPSAVNSMNSDNRKKPN